MERMILFTIKHVREVNKKGMDIRFILRRISKTSTTNLDEDLLKIEIMEMVNKGIIEKSYKILNEHGLQLTNRQMQEETLITPEEINNDNTAQHSKEASTSSIYSHKTPARKSKNQKTFLNMRPIAFTTSASNKNNFRDTKCEECILQNCHVVVLR